MTETETPQPAAREHEPRSVIIRPWPKVVFFWPTLVAALVCWVAQAAGAGTTVPVGPDEVNIGSRLAGNTFMVVFLMNTLVIAFDFSRIKSITLLIVVVAAVLGLGWADAAWGISGGVKDVVNWIDLRMNTQFYGFLTVFFTGIMLIVLVNTRFNYYEVNHREILHHHGYLGDITRMPTQGLRLNKEIYDLFEYLLLRSGRLVFYPSTAREAIVIDNVVGVNKVEARIKNLLSVVAVRMHEDEPL